MVLKPRPVHVPTSGASGPNGLATCGNGCRVSFSMAGNGRKAKSGDSSMNPQTKSGRYEENARQHWYGCQHSTQARALSRTGRHNSVRAVRKRGRAGPEWPGPRAGRVRRIEAKDPDAVALASP